MIRKRLRTYDGVVKSTPEFKEIHASRCRVKMIMFQFDIAGKIYDTLVLTGNAAITPATLRRGCRLRVAGRRSRLGDLYATAAEFLAPAT